MQMNISSLDASSVKYKSRVATLPHNTAEKKGKWERETKHNRKEKKLNRRNGRKRFGYVVSGDVAADAIFLFIDSCVLVVLVVVVKEREREELGRKV